MLHRSRGRAAAALLVLLALAGTACSRGSDENETGGGDPTTAPPGGDDGGSTTTAPAGETNRLDAAGFGDLENVCQDGDASGATDVGVTDTEIHIGTFTDKGYSARPGLTQEMY